MLNIEKEITVNRRAQCLDIAREAVLKDRNTDYGDPEDNFRGIGSYWNTHLYEKFRLLAKLPNTGVTYNPHIGEWTVSDSVMDVLVDSIDVATMMVLMKMARTITSPGKMDNWADGSGYAACGADVACAK